MTSLDHLLHDVVVRQKHVGADKEACPHDPVSVVQFNSTHPPRLGGEQAQPATDIKEAECLADRTLQSGVRGRYSRLRHPAGLNDNGRLLTKCIYICFSSGYVNLVP